MGEEGAKRNKKGGMIGLQPKRDKAREIECGERTSWVRGKKGTLSRKRKCNFSRAWLVVGEPMIPTFSPNGWTDRASV